MEDMRIKIRKQWYKKNGQVKVGYTPILETLGHTILLKTVNKRDYYVFQELMNNGTIPVIEVNTQDNPKDLDNAGN